MIYFVGSMEPLKGTQIFFFPPDIFLMSFTRSSKSFLREHAVILRERVKLLRERVNILCSTRGYIHCRVYFVI